MEKGKGEVRERVGGGGGGDTSGGGGRRRKRGRESEGNEKV